MRCVIPGRSVKLFAKAIHCLSRIGDELYLEALSQGLALRTVNSSRSAYACFLFNESFFISYDDGANDLSGDSQGEDLLKCKIAMKKWQIHLVEKPPDDTNVGGAHEVFPHWSQKTSCLSAFKSMNTIEKTVDQCKIDLNIKEARLVFLLYCRHGITKTYNLTFQECETLQAVFSKDLCPNFMTAQARILNDAVYNFPNNQEEITLLVCPETFKVKNYVDDEPDSTKIIHTEMMLAPEEFDNYQIGVDTDVTFCLKELRAILTFAEFSSQPLNVHFETGGKPIVFSMDGDSAYEADFVLATLVDHDSSLPPSQASVTASSNTSAKSVTSKDKQAKSSAKTKTMQRKATATTHNNTDAAENVRERDAVSNNDYDDTMFNNDDDDDLDITEIDHVLQGKAPLSSPNTREQESKGTNRKTTETEQKPPSQRSVDANKSSVLDDFFSDSFPYQELFTTGRKELSVIHEASQETADTFTHGSAKPIQTPSSSVTEVSFLKNVDMPSLGTSSCTSPDAKSQNISGQKKTRKHEPDPEESFMEVEANDDYDFIPGTPPHKKFKSMFFSASAKHDMSHDVVLAADSDED